MSEREPIEGKRTVLISWLGVLALGIWLFFEGLDARGEQLEIRRRVQEYRERRDELEDETTRARLKIDRIKRNDPAAIKGEAQKWGHIEKGWKAIDEGSTTPRKRETRTDR